MNLSEVNNIKLPSLSERAMLVRLSRSMYQPYAYDQATTVKVEVDTGVRKAGRFNKRLLLDCWMLKDTNSAFNDVYQYHMLHSTPWLDDGVRMIPSTSYFDYTQAMKELIDAANKKADQLSFAWDALVQEDIKRLGPLANAADYPTDIRSKYALSLKFMPVPEASDFRVEISDEDKATLASAITEAEQGVTKYLLNELLDPVKKAVDKLSIPIGAEGSIFRDSLLSNLTDVARRARKLNITQDPTINALVDDINATVSGFVKAPDRLREDIGARSATQEKLADIMSKMGAFMGS